MWKSRRWGSLNLRSRHPLHQRKRVQVSNLNLGICQG
jgi:hypothetical protein